MEGEVGLLLAIEDDKVGRSVARLGGVDLLAAVELGVFLQVALSVVERKRTTTAAPVEIVRLPAVGLGRASGGGDRRSVFRVLTLHSIEGANARGLSLDTGHHRMDVLGSLAVLRLGAGDKGLSGRARHIFGLGVL